MASNRPILPPEPSMIVDGRREGGGAIMDRPGVGCGVAILNEAGDLLLIQRRKAPQAGHWGLPGGKVDFFEDTRTTAAREVQEELGVTATIGELLCLTEEHHEEETGRYHWVSPVYRAASFEGEPVLKEPDKHSGLGWFALDALPSPLTEPTCQVLPHLRTKGAPGG